MLNTNVFQKLRIKFGISILLVTSILMILFALFNYSSQKEELKNKLVTNAESTLDRLSNNLVKPLWYMDVDLVSNTILSEMNSQENFAIIVRETEDDNFLLAKKRDGDWNVVEGNETIQHEDLRFSKEIKSEDNLKLGSVDLMVTTQFMEDELSDAFMSNMQGVLIINVILFVALFIIMKFIILNKIEKLVHTSKEVSKGNFDIKIGDPGFDELGILATNFNSMIENIKKLMTDITEEKKIVEEKERSLSETMSAMEEQKSYLNNSVEVILNEMEEFADGDLSIKLQIKSDDAIGKLYSGFNKSVVKIRELVKQINYTASKTNEATQDISLSTEQLAAGTEEQTAQTIDIASAVEEMTITISETSKNASLAAESSKEAGKIAVEGGRVVDNTVNEINKISEVVADAAKIVSALGESSDQIGNIVEVINEIADQTNLLALNAAIEAARAGEHGRGFSVVADEVRKLAERTTNATKEISEMITQIQNDTSSAVTSMKVGTEQVENGREHAQRAGKSLNRIIESTNQVVEVVSQVAVASEQQSSAAQQISHNIEGIRSISESSSENVGQVAQKADELRDVTTNLHQLINSFRIEEIDDVDIKYNFSQNLFKEQISL